MKRRQLPILITLIMVVASPLSAADWPKVTKVDRQPLAAQARRVAQALDYLGAPLPADDKKALETAAEDQDEARAVEAIQTVLDRYCLAGVRITTVGGSSPNQLVLETQRGPAKPELAEQGWRLFLVKVDNPAGVKDFELRADSPNALPLVQRSSSKPDPKVISVGEVGQRFVDLPMFNSQPLVRDLSGLELEYRILQIYCRDAGRKEAKLGFSLWRSGAKDQRVAVSKQPPIDFDSIPAVLVKLHVHDFDQKPTTASFIFRDRNGRVYPSQSRRLAPDFFFHGAGTPEIITFTRPAALTMKAPPKA